MRIGIMGGTFDPIHIAHLILGETAWYEFRLDKVLFMPAVMLNTGFSGVVYFVSTQ